MYCSKCGKQIDDNSKFCPYCGAQVAFAKPAEPGLNVQQKMQGFQNNEKVKKAQKSLNGGWTAIKTILKNPSAEVELGTGEMIVIGIAAVIVQTLGIFLLCKSAFKIVMSVVSLFAGVIGQGSSMSSLMNGVALNVNFGMALLTGILLTALIFIIYIGAHCASDRTFKNWNQYFSHATAGLIIPSVALLLCGIFGSMNGVIGMVFGLFAVVDILVHTLGCFKKEDSQYIILLYATISVAVLALAAVMLGKGIITESSIIYDGEKMKLKDVIAYYSSLSSYFTN